MSASADRSTPIKFIWVNMYAIYKSLKAKPAAEAPKATK